MSNVIRGQVKTTGSGGGGGATGTIGAAVPSTAAPIAVKDNSGNLAYPQVDASGKLIVAVTGAGSGGTSSVDNSGYTAGTTAGTPLMGAVDDTGTTAAVENDVAIARITPQRAVHVNLRRQDGTEVGTTSTPLSIKSEQQLDYDTGAGTASQSLVGIALPASGGPVAGGTATNPLRVDPTGTTTQPVSAASLPLPTGAAQDSTVAALVTQSDFDSKVGSLTETAPASDTASSGLNGRLQRIAQRLTTLIALLPSALVGGRLDVNLGAAPATVTNSPIVPTVVSNGNKNVTTAGTRVTLAASATIKSVTIKAKFTNTGIIYVGDTGVTSANGFQLYPGESISLDIADPSTVNLDAQVSGEGVTYIAVN